MKVEYQLKIKGGHNLKRNINGKKNKRKHKKLQIAFLFLKILKSFINLTILLMETIIKMLIISILSLYFYSCSSTQYTANNDSEEIDLVENEDTTDRFTDAQMNYYEEEIRITEYE